MTLEEILVRQAGVVTLAQAVAAGMSPDTVHRRVREGRWRRRHPRVYLVGGHRLTAEARVRAAWRWAGEGAVLTGPSAAWWHGMLERPPEQIDLAIPRRRRLDAPPGVRIQRRDLPAGSDVAVARGLRLTSPPLAALETAAVLPDGSVFLDRALQRHVRFPAVHRAYCRQLGRWGSREAGRLLVAAADRADSAAERLMITLLRRDGARGWVVGHPFAGWRIDVAFPAWRIAVEVDGWAWHVDVERFRNDRRKGNALGRAGWTLLRFTWHDLDQRPADVIAEIKDAVLLAA